MVVVVHRSAFATTVPPEKALAVVEALEKRIQVLRWKARGVQAWAANAKDLKSIVRTRPGFFYTQVVFDPVGRRYRIEMQQVGEWIKGAAPFYADRSEFAFDGEVYRGWHRGQPGKELPSAESGREGMGAVSKDRNDMPNREDVVGFCCTGTGLAYMPPYFYDGESPNQPFSRLLRKWIDEKRSVSIVEDEQGVWTITTPIKYAKRGGFRLRIRYDPTKGGVVTGAQWLFVDKDREIENGRLEVELQKVTDWLWVPRTSRWGATLDRQPPVAMGTYEAVEVNFPVDATTFALEFPKRVQVFDHISKSLYVTGTPTDEASAVRAYMQAFRLTGAVRRPNMAMYRRIAIVVFAVIAVAGAAVFLVRKKRRRLA